MSLYTVQSTNIYLDVNGVDLPPGVSISVAVIREFCEYAVPILDVVIVDSLGLIGQNIDLKDGTILNCCIFYGNGSTSIKPMPFKIAAVTPVKVRKITAYHVSAFFNSNLLYCMNNWSFAGTLKQTFTNIFSQEPVQLPLNIEIPSTQASSYVKYANETFAHYFRRVLMPSLPQTNTSYYLYYHSGTNILVQNILQSLREFNQQSAKFVLTSNSYINWFILSNCFDKNMNGNAYGVNSYRYDVDTSNYELINSAESYIKYNINKDNVKQQKSIFISASQGNHPVNYNQNGVSNLANKSIFNVEAEVQINYPSYTKGLDVIPFYYEDSKYIPFVLLGKSIVISNGLYLEKLHIASNTIDQSILSCLGG